MSLEERVLRLEKIVELLLFSGVTAECLTKEEMDFLHSELQHFKQRAPHMLDEDFKKKQTEYYRACNEYRTMLENKGLKEHDV